LFSFQRASAPLIGDFFSLPYCFCVRQQLFLFLIFYCLNFAVRLTATFLIYHLLITKSTFITAIFYRKYIPKPPQIKIKQKCPFVQTVRRSI